MQLNPFSCQSIQYLERQPGQARAWKSSGHTKTSEVCSVWPYVLQHKTQAETPQAGTTGRLVSNVHNAVVYYSHMLMLHTKGPETAIQDYQKKAEKTKKNMRDPLTGSRINKVLCQVLHFEEQVVEELCTHTSIARTTCFLWRRKKAHRRNPDHQREQCPQERDNSAACRSVSQVPTERLQN